MTTQGNPPTLILAWPFKINGSGTVATVSNPALMLRQQVAAVVGTQRGERVMQPDYGIDVTSILFGNNDDATEDVLRVEIENAMKQWLPEVEFVAANIESDPASGVKRINVTYRSNLYANMPNEQVSVPIDSRGV